MSIDFIKSELDATRKLVNERWNDEEKPIHLADIDYAQEEETEPKPYPALVWEDKSTTFVVLKMDILSYKSFFYHLRNKRYDTGILEYTDIVECVTSLMQSQANFLLEKNAKNREKLKKDGAKK